MAMPLLYPSNILYMHTLPTTETVGLGTCLELVVGVDTGKREKLKLAWEAVSGTHGCPYLSRSVRMDLGTPHRLGVSSMESFANVDFPTEIDGSRRKWSLGFRKKLTGPDCGRGLRGRRYGSGGEATVRYGPRGIPTGPPGALWGPFSIFPNFRVWALAPFLGKFPWWPV